jgi:hypothetical protein
VFLRHTLEESNTSMYDRVMLYIKIIISGGVSTDFIITNVSLF